MLKDNGWIGDLLKKAASDDTTVFVGVIGPTLSSEENKAQLKNFMENRTECGYAVFGGVGIASSVIYHATFNKSPLEIYIPTTLESWLEQLEAFRRKNPAKNAEVYETCSLLVRIQENPKLGLIIAGDGTTNNTEARRACQNRLLDRVFSVLAFAPPSGGDELQFISQGATSRGLPIYQHPHKA